MPNSSQFTVSTSPQTLMERLRSAAASEHRYRMTQLNSEKALSFTFEKVTQRSIIRGWYIDVVYTTHGKLTATAGGGTNVELRVTVDWVAATLTSILPGFIALLSFILLLNLLTADLLIGETSRALVIGISVLLMGVLIVLVVVFVTSFVRTRNELLVIVEAVLKR